MRMARSPEATDIYVAYDNFAENKCFGGQEEIKTRMLSMIEVLHHSIGGFSLLTLH